MFQDGISDSTVNSGSKSAEQANALNRILQSDSLHHTLPGNLKQPSATDRAQQERFERVFGILQFDNGGGSKDEKAEPGFINHSKRTWTNVLNGKASTAEYAEAGAEVAGALLLIYAGRRLYRNWGTSNRETFTIGKEGGAGAKQWIEIGPSQTFDKAPIPDVVRPFISNSKLLSAEEVTRKGLAYRDDVGNLFKLPRSVVGEVGDTGQSVAEKLLKARGAITGERVTAEAITKEATRLQELNPELTQLANWEGKAMIAYNDASFAKLAMDTQFKHVPPIGQFLKATGKVTEEHIQDAFKYQKTLPQDAPRRFLGEILEDKGIVTKAEVDAAFGAQNEMKSYLKEILSNLK